MSTQERVFRGNGVSPGVAAGQALRLDSHNRLVLKLLIDEKRVSEEIARFREALQKSREQLTSLRTDLATKVGHEHSFILDVHLLMLEDQSLVTEIESIIRYTRSNAEWAVRQALDRIIRAYESLEDSYFRERRTDIENVVERILHNLAGGRPTDWNDLPGSMVIVSHDFNPSAFAVMELEKVAGMVLESGGRTSHTAILARGLRLPAVMEVGPMLSSVGVGDMVIVDGYEGEVVINPSTDRMEELRKRVDSYRALITASAPEQPGGLATSDGTPVHLMANLELPSETRMAQRMSAHGIGLFRSEFIFFAHPFGFPSVEEQREIYSLLAREMAPYPVTIRTLDTAADKVLAGMDLSLQPNPGMGLRGIRLSLLSDHVFRDQIEAILRSSEDGRVEMVLPMVSSIEEVEQAKAVLEQVRRNLPDELARRTQSVPLGIMIEVPAAVLSLEELARHADFLCIGTNDLIQYMLAVDRGNPQVSHLYQPLHPSILKALRRVARSCAESGKRVRVCGEVSANPLYAALLVGMGFRELSMNAASIPVVRELLSSVSSNLCRDIAERALELPTASEVGALLLDSLRDVSPVDLAPYTREIGIGSGRPSQPYVP